MQPLRSSGARAIRQGSRQLSRQQPRRHASQGTDKPVDPHTSHSSTEGGAPGTESFGKGFYYTIAAIPLTYLIYNLSPSSSSPLDSSTASNNNFITRLFDKYKESQTALAEKNALHTHMVEVAANERNLFLNTRSPNHYELRSPEQLTSQSPINVPAGHGSANISHLIEHYQRKADEDEKKKLELMRKGELPAQIRERGFIEAGYGKPLPDEGRARLTGVASKG